LLKNREVNFLLSAKGVTDRLSETTIKSWEDVKIPPDFELEDYTFRPRGCFRGIPFFPPGVIPPISLPILEQQYSVEVRLVVPKAIDLKLRLPVFLLYDREFLLKDRQIPFPTYKGLGLPIKLKHDPRGWMQPDKEGFLVKRGDHLKIWKKRYVRLQATNLFIFKKKKKAPKEIISLVGATIEKNPTKYSKRSNCILIRPLNSLRDFFIDCETSDALHQWYPLLLKLSSTEFPQCVEILSISGHDFTAKDITGKSDPYIVVSVGSSHVRTQIKKKTLNPVWDSKDCKGMILPAASTDDVVHFKVMDREKTSKDDPMGFAEVSCELFSKELHQKLMLPLLNSSKSDKAKGNITVELQWKGAPPSTPTLFKSKVEGPLTMREYDITTEFPTYEITPNSHVDSSDFPAPDADAVALADASTISDRPPSSSGFTLSTDSSSDE